MNKPVLITLLILFLSGCVSPDGEFTRDDANDVRLMAKGMEVDRAYSNIGYNTNYGLLTIGAVLLKQDMKQSGSDSFLDYLKWSGTPDADEWVQPPKDEYLLGSTITLKTDRYRKRTTFSGSILTNDSGTGLSIKVIKHNKGEYKYLIYIAENSRDLRDFEVDLYDLNGQLLSPDGAYSSKVIQIDVSKKYLEDAINTGISLRRHGVDDSRYIDYKISSKYINGFLNGLEVSLERYKYYLSNKDLIDKNTNDLSNKSGSMGGFQYYLLGRKHCHNGEIQHAIKWFKESQFLGYKDSAIALNKIKDKCPL